MPPIKLNRKSPRAMEISSSDFHQEELVIKGKRGTFDVQVKFCCDIS